jgi:hypothetical protein
MVTGEFETAGGVQARGIAKWDGANWSALGSDTKGGVYAFAVSKSALYAGGWFFGLDGGAVKKWDGNNWSTLGSGMGDAVQALAVSRNELYAGLVDFGGPAQRIVKWTGTSWAPLGSGVSTLPLYGGEDGWVRALTASGDSLYVGGEFFAAGGKVSINVARAIVAPAEDRLAVRQLNGQIELSWPGSLLEFELQERDDLSASEWRAVAGAAAIVEDRNTLILEPAPGTRFYRLQTP